MKEISASAKRAAAGARVLASMVAVVMAAGAAWSEEYCVICTGPGAVYRCEPEGFGGGQDNRAQIACISGLARLEGHKSCSLDRRGTENCQGPLRVLRRDLLPDAPGETDAPAAREPAAAPPPATALPPQPSLAARAFAKASDTVSATAKTAGGQIESAGKTAGTAAAKAWNCLTSLGTNC